MAAEIANTLEQFEVGGIDQTHDEMLNRINEKTAQNEARMEMALESVDTDGLKMDEEAEKLRAQELVRQFKADMNINTAGTGNVSAGSGSTSTNDNLNKTL